MAAARCSPRPPAALMLAAAVLARGAAAGAASTPTSGFVAIPDAFTPAECDAIVAHFRGAAVAERDVRVHESVSRTNRFDHDAASEAYWPIYERVLALLRAHAVGASADPVWGFDLSSVGSGVQLGALVDFVLLHEFKAGDFFDWHVDTKPHDGTGRTVNINVMLSPPGAYGGGALSVGSTLERPSAQGELLLYPAALPHRVGDVTAGTRHTLVIAIKVDEAARAASRYWAAAEANHAALRAALPAVPKLHQLRAEWHAARGEEAEADGAFADMYAATPQAAAYAQRFDADGQRLLREGQPHAAAGHFAMAARVDPSVGEYAARRDAALAALRELAAEEGG